MNKYNKISIKKQYSAIVVLLQKSLVNNKNLISSENNKTSFS